MSQILPPDAPPELWRPARSMMQRFARPIEVFLSIQAASGILLLIAAAVALLWANSPWRESYHALWHLPVRFGIGSFQFEQSLHFVVNEGLMVIFFFVVGLEVRRELYEGELSDPRRAALPAAAALGGMLAPAAIYLAINAGQPGRAGWGVPMATDIAFAVGVLVLLGKRVPAAVRVLLLALAIIDDIGAIVVIAIFYSSGVSATWLLVALLGVLLAVALRGLGVRQPWAYVPAGIVVWTGFLSSGVHPSIAGVLLGLLTPVRAWFGASGFLAATERALGHFRARVDTNHGHHDLLEPLEAIALARREAVPPVVRLEAALHPWVAYGILPIFALANAGVDLSELDLSAAGANGVILGVGFGLVLGKPIGILLASFLSVKLGIAALPRGMTYQHVGLVGMVAGIGFTMAIFIASLAFPDPGMLGVAKLGVLGASAVAGVLGLAIGRLLLQEPSRELAGIHAHEAERSTEH